MLSKEDKIEQIIESMKAEHKKDGVTMANYDVTWRYYLDDATDREIDEDYQKWCFNSLQQ